MKKSQILLFLMNMLSGMGYSIVSPLFPELGEKGALGEDLLGFLISIYALSSFFLVPFAPIFCKKFGRINLLYISTFGEATCMLLYGILSFISHFYLLITIMFIIRIIHGICAGFVGVLVYSLVSSISDTDEVQLALGYMEVAWCIGLSGGPLCAAIFYKIGGYFLPFIVLGVILYVSVYFTEVISEEKIEAEEEDKEEHSFMKLLFNVNIILVLSYIGIGVIVNTFYFPSLTNHLTTNYGLSVSVSSLFFIVGLIFYMIFLQFLNLLTDRFGFHGTPCIGLLMGAIGSLLVYPVPPFPQNIFFILLGLCLIGGVGGPLYVTGLINLSKYIRKIDPSIDEYTANDIGSAMYQFINNVGDFVGPVLGGFISKFLGFKYSCLIISILIFIFLGVFMNQFMDTIKNEFFKKQEMNITDIKNEFGRLSIDSKENKGNNSYERLSITELLCFRTNCLSRKNSFIKKHNKLNSSNGSLYTSLTN